jgi:putative SOS response-associated peptidase YedK
MCNHYQGHPEAIATWAEWAGFRNATEPTATLDLWPKRPATVARVEGGDKILDTMNWGVPRTMPGKRPGTTVTKHVTNVRNLSGPFWKSMLANPERRCLVPFTRFAEPKPGTNPETGRPAEHWFHVTDRTVAAFAGIWRPSEAGNVFAFLTCEPNPLVAPLHPKAMPVVLQEDDYDGWLSGDYDAACGHAVPYPSQLMAVS